MRLALTMFAATATMTMAATAAAQLPAATLYLPTTSTAIVGTGSNPSLGVQANQALGVHFMDDSGNPAFRVWDTTSQTSTSSPLSSFPLTDYDFSYCDWGDSVLFCVGHKDLTQGYYEAVVTSYDYAAPSPIHKYSTFGTPSVLKAQSLRAVGASAVVESDDGKVDLLVNQALPFLSKVTVATSSLDADSHPALSEESVAYQRKNGSNFDLVLWDRVTTTAITTPLSVEELRPSQVHGDWVTVDTPDSAIEVYGPNPGLPGGVGGDHGRPEFTPSTHGCQQFRNLKYDLSDVQLVRGVNCTVGGVVIPSTLFAMKWETSLTYQAYLVGFLSASDPAYDAFDNHVVYTNDQGQVIWVLVNTAQM